MDHAPDRLRFAVLGPVRAWRAGTELDLGPRQQRAVLVALLLRRGCPVSADELIDGVWGEDSPRTALGAVRTYVSRLRHLLEPARPDRRSRTVLVSIGDGYALRTDRGATDLEEFERLLDRARAARMAGDLDAAGRTVQQALGLWRGEPMVGIPGPFAEGRRLAMSERGRSAMELRIELDLAAGRYDEAGAELFALVAEYPLRERLTELLMVALYSAGRQAEALAAYTRTRRVLDDRLGIDPGPRLRDLHRRILTADCETLMTTVNGLVR
nr:AfsR/SARP family transcriptional regulator [Kibdelosporangium sp. MJ126-NF4]CEL21548.1 regulatory protein [Kibdelosporangium sp. MJ126-NF4]CTQ95885.1 regulatory protein [Kibdelosporangium sp. MJ126-NF4]